eukprot:scaffold227325_cov15-Tisochrysis_lutea.AAC.1
MLCLTQLQAQKRRAATLAKLLTPIKKRSLRHMASSGLQTSVNCKTLMDAPSLEEEGIHFLKGHVSDNIDLKNKRCVVTWEKSAFTCA